MHKITFHLGISHHILEESFLVINDSKFSNFEYCTSLPQNKENVKSNAFETILHNQNATSNILKSILHNVGSTKTVM